MPRGRESCADCVMCVCQVIVDDCGTCQEAESLVPIVSCQPRQVTLFGDNQQLQPMVMNDTSRSFGLDRSLFDRYATQAHMLTIQYRMVSSSHN